MKPTEPTPERGDAGVTAAGAEGPPVDREGSRPVTQFNVSDHELLRRIGSGAYGDVWLARNVLGELRAVKVIHRSRFNDERPFEREFEGIQRFEPISRSHPSQLAVLHVGKNEAAGCFYYVMELADGEEIQNEKCKMKNEAAANPTASSRQQSILNLEFYILNYRPKTLRSLLRPNPQPSTLNSQPTTIRLPISDCVQIGLSLTTALAHLHQHGLVHRDIKPSNVIFVNGVPKLGDIGLVTEAGDTQSIVGTEGYIPPEGPGTRQADIFSLGKVLYEISTGLDRRRFAELPEDLRDWPDRNAVVEFNEIVLKACAKDSARRYQSAEEMQADLALLQRGESVKAKRSTRRRIILFSRIGLVAAVLALLLAGGWFVSTKVNWRKPGSTERKVTPAQQQEARRLYTQATTLPFNTQAALNEGIELLNRAIVEDPNYGEAYARLALSYAEASEVLLPPRQASTEAKKNALSALQIDEALPEAHIALGYVFFYHEFDPTNAEAHFRRVIALAPREGRAYGDLARMLSLLGRFPEAEKALQQGERADPKSHNLHCGWCWRYYLERRFEDCLAAATRLQTLHSNSIMAPSFLAYAHERLAHYDKALPLAQETVQLDPGPDLIGFLGMVHGRMGHSGEARKALEELRVMSQSRRVSGVYPAQVLLGLGDKDGAIEQLQRAVEEYHATVIGLKANPLWDELRSHPQFVELLGKMKLAQ